MQWRLMRGERLMSFAFEKIIKKRLMSYSRRRNIIRKRFISITVETIPLISLGCKLVPVLYREYEYDVFCGSVYVVVFSGEIAACMSVLQEPTC